MKNKLNKLLKELNKLTIYHNWTKNGMKRDSKGIWVHSWQVRKLIIKAFNAGKSYETN